MITSDMNYVYAYVPEDETEYATYTVTFQVVNGAWNDGTRESQTVTLTNRENANAVSLFSANEEDAATPTSIDDAVTPANVGDNAPAGTNGRRLNRAARNAAADEPEQPEDIANENGDTPEGGMGASGDNGDGGTGRRQW